MSKSIYIQRKRTKGFNLQAQSPDGRPVVSCTRPSKWGNPYPVFTLHNKQHLVNGYWNEPNEFEDRLEALRFSVGLFIGHIDQNGTFIKWGSEPNDHLHTEQIRHHLAGKHLSCWCKPGEPCHVQDVLLPIINDEPIKTY